MKNKLVTKGRNQMGHKNEPTTKTEYRNCTQQTNNDYFYAADRDLGDNDSDKYVWLKDTWSYMEDRELVTQIDSEQKDTLGSTTIILEGTQTKKRKNRGKETSLIEISKKIKYQNEDKKVIVVADAMIDGHSFFLPHAKIKCDDELCFNSQPAIDIDRQSVTRFIELMKAMEYIDLILIPPMPQVEIQKYEIFGKDTLMVPLTGNRKGSDIKTLRKRSINKYIDFSLTGTITEHRMNIVKALRSKGYSVTIAGIHTPEYLRNELYEASWVDLCPLLYENSETQSLMKAKYNLDREHHHIFERPRRSDFETIDILKHVFYSKDDFINDACDLLNKVKANKSYFVESNMYYKDSRIKGKKFCDEYKTLTEER